MIPRRSNTLTQGVVFVLEKYELLHNCRNLEAVAGKHGQHFTQSLSSMANGDHKNYDFVSCIMKMKYDGICKELNTGHGVHGRSRRARQLSEALAAPTACLQPASRLAFNIQNPKVGGLVVSALHFSSSLSFPSCLPSPLASLCRFSSNQLH